MTTRTRHRLALLAVLALLAAAGPAHAGNKVKVAAARVGLPPGRNFPNTREGEEGQAAYVAKFATWAPVYVDLEGLAAVSEPAELVIEGSDADEVTTVLAVPVGLPEPGETLTARQMGMMPYLRPPGGTGEITIYVRTTAGEVISEPFRIKDLRPRDPLTYVVLSLNGKLPAFELPKPAAAGQTETASGAIRGGRVELAAITDVSLLPDQWFGYSAADLVVLTTGGAGSGEFLDRLFGAGGSDTDRARGAALLEWVRRGGRLVISTGVNAGLLATRPTNPAFRDMLPAVIDPKNPIRAVGELYLTWAARETSQAGILSGTLAVRGGTITAAKLTRRTDRPGRIIVPAPARQEGRFEPVAMQSAYGLGRVTLIGFDLDRPPFTHFASRAEFWDWVLREGGAARASAGPEGKQPTGQPDDEDELAVALRTHIDTFDGVPVISFGWVAVFIALYILLIGPVEYFFLKKILRRLELTWVTFPIIVITVSAAACLTAYAVKGRDLKVNKVDVVEVDPASGRVYGTTWFSVFSPRIDTYTVGVTPAPGLAAPERPGGTTIGWVGSPRAGRAGLIRRKYQFHVDPDTRVVADGMAGVPIQVWSTKAFTANWSAPLDPASPAVESRLIHPPGDPAGVIGSFVNRMPFPELTDCVAFYAGKAYPLGPILPDSEVRLVLDPSREAPAAQWLQNESQLSAVLARVSSVGNQPAATATRTGTPAAQAGPGNTLPLLGLLFHEAALRNDEGVYARNGSLRRLDQSWRLSPANRDEVILVGRVLPPVGPAEETLGGPASPTRLWLRGLPGHGRDRTPIPGTGRQETYVRLYLPVRPAGATH